eukprot:200979-Prymnesium_polylepis.1
MRRMACHMRSGRSRRRPASHICRHPRPTRLSKAQACMYRVCAHLSINSIESAPRANWMRASQRPRRTRSNSSRNAVKPRHIRRFRRRAWTCVRYSERSTMREAC